MIRLREMRSRSRSYEEVFKDLGNDVSWLLNKVVKTVSEFVSELGKKVVDGVVNAGHYRRWFALVGVCSCICYAVYYNYSTRYNKSLQDEVELKEVRESIVLDEIQSTDNVLIVS